ncbi:hypothetical protein MICAE_710007 [Microcystis aeruginosa PCC 9806]|uniref:Uncharacterized protein n=1 Tax=Microcystis aeruginosa PCC 9806 TaxID=1160282 RepID=I4H1N2_MICAE|nr:hypothetical protein MICAE_710007 [Microcystis aeruginosa PCC 9806]
MIPVVWYCQFSVLIGTGLRFVAVVIPFVAVFEAFYDRHSFHPRPTENYQSDRCRRKL